MPLSLQLLSRRAPMPVVSASARRHRTLALAEVPLPLQPHPAQPSRTAETLACTLWHESSFDLLQGLEVAELDSWPPDCAAGAPAHPAGR